MQPVQEVIASMESSGRRHRHRSRRRKAVESVALVIGVPILLALVLGLSMELIEYRPYDDSAVRHAQPIASAIARPRPDPQPQRTPAVVVETPQITLEGSSLRR